MKKQMKKLADDFFEEGKSASELANAMIQRFGFADEDMVDAYSEAL